MPRIFRLGPYWVYFWSNESNPIEPIHVHVSKGNPTANATKIWITKQGMCYLCHNQSRIPQKDLRNILRIIEAQSDEIIQEWLNCFGEIRYFC